MAASETTGRRLDGRRLVVVAIATVTVLLSCTAVSETPVHADRIVVFKAKRTLFLYQGDKVLKTYRIALGRRPTGAKTRQRDHKTPEGAYRIDAKNSKSQFHLALHVSYPNENDRLNARKSGVNTGGTS
jgi:murein L,D-transpeptidase YafK